MANTNTNFQVASATTTNITLNDFIGIKDSNGNFNTWTDIWAAGFIDNLVNPEIYAIPGLPTPDEIVGTNIYFENTIFQAVENFDDDITKGANAPVLDKSVMLLSDEYMVSWNINKLDQKSATGWSRYLASNFGNGWKAIRDIVNLISMEAYVDYSLATGQYKILENLDDTSAPATDVFNDAFKLQAIGDAIASTRTKTNLGESPDRIRFLMSYTAYRNLNRGFSGNYSGANLAYISIKEGAVAMFGSYALQRTLYLGQNVAKGSVTNNTRDFLFADVPAIVLSIDTLAYYWQLFGKGPEGDLLSLGDSWINNWVVQAGRSKMVASIIFRANAIIKPARQELSYVIFNGERTLAQVNAARSKLATTQPGVYASFATALTQAEVDAYNAQAIVFDK